MDFYKFKDEVHDYQRFVRDNIQSLGDLIIITEQLYFNNNEKGFIDILALDLTEKRLVILELKNVFTEDKIMWQPVRYYDVLRRAEDGLKQLLYLKKPQIPFDINEIDFIPKILIVVPDFNEQLLRSFSYLEDFKIEVIKFNFNVKLNEIIKETYKPSNIYHKEDLVDIKSKVSKNWNFDEYLKDGVNNAKISLAKQFVNYVKNKFEEKNKKVDLFFYDKYITVIVEGKVWGHIFIKKKLFDPYLDISFDLNKKKVNPIELQLCGGVINYKIQTRVINLCFSQLPISFLKNYI